MQNFSTIRASLVFFVIFATFGTLVGRVAYLQTYGRQQTIRRAERQQHQNSVLEARRGNVQDRNGILMAGTVQTQTLFIDAHFMTQEYQTAGRSLVDMDEAVAKLARILDRKPFEISQLLSDRSEARYLKIAENLEENTVLEIEKLRIPGVGFLPTSVRNYPMGSLAAHILGGVGKDGKGLEGLEMRFEPVLAGRNGYVRELKDAHRRPINVSAEDYLPPQHGQHLMLTIDTTIQMIAEQELAASCEKFKAARGEVVILDPRTGEVLALANWPTFNPQNLEDSTNDLRRNRALTDPYEPGSTLKPFTAGPALAQGIVRMNEMFPIHGPHWFTPYGRPVTDVHGYPQLAFWDVLVKSSNIGMSMLGERMGNPRLHAALTGFGFGKPTGIELPAEDGGRLNPLKRWGKFSTDSIAQGYEIMVTPLQLARGMAVYANGGRLVQPHIIQGILDADGNLIARSELVSRTMQAPQIIDPDSASAIRRILADVPVRGTAAGRGSLIYNIFGKTGTAHISGGKAGYNASKFTSSFICGAPYENPRLVAAFVIHEPDRAIAHYGGYVAAPGACQMIERALEYLQVPASPNLTPPPEAISKVLWDFKPGVYDRKAKSAIASRD